MRGGVGVPGTGLPGEEQPPVDRPRQVGAAVGAAIGGPLCDRYGRKAIYTYDLLVYMAGVLLAAFALNFTMLLAAFIITGLAVGWWVFIIGAVAAAYFTFGWVYEFSRGKYAH